MKRTLIVLAVVLTACMAWSGERVRFMCANHTITDAFKILLADFEKETGIKVELESLGEEQLTQKLSVEFSAGSSDIDVFMTRPLQEGRLFARNRWYEDLTPYVSGDASYDFADFTPGSVAATKVGDVQCSIPLSTEVQVMYYRKDLLAEKGIAPPETFEELEKAAALLTDKNKEIYGFLSRGQRNPLITQFSSYVYGYGSDWYDFDTNKSLVDTPEFIEAVGFYGEMLRKYGPPGSLNMGWPQAVAVFAQGKAAIYTDGGATFPSLLDPAKSTVAEVTGIAMFPAGPKGRKMYAVTPWAIAMSSSSKNKDASWKLIRYLTDKERTLLMQGTYANPCARLSVYNMPEGVKTFPKDFVKAFNDSTPYAVPYDRPLVTAVVEARDIIGETVTTAISGGDYAQAAKVASQRFQEILDREALEK